MARYLDNPAGRLHALLDDLRAKQQQQAASAGWADVLGVPQGAPLAYALAAVMQLPDDAEAQIQRVAGRYAADFLGWRPSVDRTLAATFTSAGAALNQVTQQYDGEALARLEACSLELHRHAQEKSVDADRLAEVRQKVEGLLSEIIEVDDLSPMLRGLLAHHLHSMMTAIDMYKIRGARGIEDALNQIVGGLVISQNEREELERKPTWWSRVQSVVAAYAVVVAAASSTLQLEQSVQLALEAHPASATSVVDGDGTATAAR